MQIRYDATSRVPARSSCHMVENEIVLIAIGEVGCAPAGLQWAGSSAQRLRHYQPQLLQLEQWMTER
ncbi:MAG: hypothetical protein ABW092_01360 [Candidatus Thiodiazotropha sp.]